MTLKEEFIDIVKLLIEPLEHVEINFNCKVNVCKNTDELKLDELCDDCESKSCNCCSQYIVDVVIDDLNYGNNWYINFNKKEGKEYITCLNNRKQMFRFLSSFKYELDYFNNFDLEFANNCDELLKYANEFFKELINKYFSHLTPEILPIKFYKGIKSDEDYLNKTLTMGEIKSHLKQNIINIYSITTNSIDEIKQYIRHEIIHYCLSMSNYTFGDDTAIFHAFCKRYDAHAYVEMPPDEKVKFDKWDESDKILEQMKTECKDMLNDKNIQDKDIESLQEQSILGLGSNDNVIDNLKNFFDLSEQLKNSYKLVLENAYSVTQSYKNIKNNN